MLFKLFNTKNPLILILIFIIDFIFSIIFYYNNNVLINDVNVYKSVFYNFFIEFNKNYNLLSRILFLIIVFFQALYISYLNKKHFFISQRTYLPSIIYLLIISLNKNAQEFSGVILSNFFIFLIIDQIFSAYKKTNATTNFFNSGLFLAVASLFYFDNIYFMLIIFIGFLIIRKFILREWISGFVGLLTTYSLYFLVYYIFNGNIDLVQYKYFFTNVIKLIYSLKNILFISFIFLILLMAVYNLIKKYDTKKISTRKFMLVFIWLLTINTILFFSIKFLDFRILFVSFMPFSYIITMYFLNIKRYIIQELFFSILIISYLVFQII